MRVRRHVAPLLLAAAGALAANACVSTPSEVPAPTPTSVAVATPGPQSSAPVGSENLPSPVATSGFAFDPESIVGYFESIGYVCDDRRPSTTAVGHEFQSCQLVDADGRTRSIGIVTDADDNVASAFLSVRGSDAEAVLDPGAVLDPFASFLGAILGEQQGTAQLPWLAAHLGDSDARTTVGDLTIATYTPSPEDHTKITVEIASRAYLDTPAPSGAAAPSRGATAPMPPATTA